VSKPTIRADIAYFVAVMVVAGRSKLGRKVSFFFQGPNC
jgi:Flp pilus assembly pilin Flp